MSQEKTDMQMAEIEIENIGGIEQSSAVFEPGVTVLTGKNATNRTSFLQAIMAACGSDRSTLKGDANEGQVELQFADETYTRILSRENGRVQFGGDPYLEDTTVADLFAFLLENNEARQAVARSDNLRDIIMRPVDTAQIEQEIRELESERSDIDDELQRLESLGDQLPELVQEKQRLKDEIADTQSELEAKRQEIGQLDSSIEETREEKEQYEAKIDELSQRRQELQNIERRLGSERESIENLESEREELKDELDELAEVSDGRLSQIDDEIQRLRGQIQRIDSTVGDLQSVIQFNEEFLEEGRPDFIKDLGGDSRSSEDTVTDKLVNDTAEVTCWTCGSNVETDQIESTLSELRDVRNNQMSDREELERQIDDLQDEKSALESRQRTIDRTRKKLAEVESEIDSREDNLDEFKERKEEVSTEVDRLSTEVDELDELEQSEILEVQKDASRLEVEVDRLESDLEDVEGEISSIRTKLEDRESLEEERDEITSRLRNLRTRVEDLQAEAIEEFNGHMDAVLERLNYENLERIWIERVQDEVREGRRKVTKDKFALHVVRSTSSGKAYEDTIEHLSESEREVTGLVFALAGYLVHEVYDQVPFMLLDSVEAIDSDRIARLVDYLAQYADYLVVALLEEDAAALDESYARIESI